MSTISKLSIQGIRSFEPHREQVIKFQKPLTLIVGSNGAGKTTIIECIKMSLTGELPPDADKGKNFIHDPKVGDAHESKACIKLAFGTSQGKTVVCTRNFTLQYKSQTKGAKANYSMHNTTLTTVDKEGKKHAISQRCAEINKMVPEFMGISKAILENVIFVHQEEANWPLRESKVLKAKFDDIFAATRYSKALEAIKKLRKVQMDKVKDEKIVLAEKRGQVQALRDIEKRIKQQENKIATLNEEMTEFKGNLDDQKEQVRELAQTKNKVEELLDRHKTCNTARDEMIRGREHFKEQIDLSEGEFYSDEPTENLVGWRDKLRVAAGDEKNGEAKTENKIREDEVSLEQQEKRLKPDQNALVLLEHKTVEYEKNLVRREECARDLASDLGVRQDNDGVRMQQECLEIEQEKSAKLSEMKAQHRRELEDLRKQCSQLRNAIDRDHEKALSSQTTRKRNTVELQNLNQQLALTEDSYEEQLKGIDNKIVELEAGVEEENRQTLLHTQKLQQAKEQQRLTKFDESKLANELETMRLQGAMLQRVEGLRSQSGEKGRKAKAEWGHIQQMLEGEVGQTVEMADAAEVASRHYKAVSERYGEAGRAAAKAESELEQLKKREAALMEEVDQHRQEQDKKQAKVDKKMSTAQRGVADPKPFDVYLKEREADLVALEGKLTAAHQEGPVFESLLDDARNLEGSCHGCPLCDRAFGHSSDWRAFEEKLRGLVETAQSGESAALLQSEIDQKRKMLDFVRKVRSLAS
jgi:DNA repair protein RAD50